MKKHLFIAVAASVLLFQVSCSNNTEDSKANTADQTVVIEDTVLKVDSAFFIIKSKSVGDFKIEGNIADVQLIKPYEIFQEEKVFDHDEGSDTLMVSVLKENGQEVLYMQPKGEWAENGEVTYEEGSIDQIYITTSIFKTEKGIGVNSTIEDFMASYPDFEIWGGQICHCIYLSSNELQSIQFELDITDYLLDFENVDIEGEILNLKDIKKGATIKEIRMF